MNNLPAEEWVKKGIELGELGRLEEALEAYNKATELDPQLAEAWYNKGVALDELGRLEEALEAYNKATEIDPQLAKAWYNKGVALYKLGRLEEELEAFTKAIEIDPHYARAWYNKGVTLGQLGRREEELEAYNKAIEIDPKDAQAWHNKGAILYELGRPPEETLEAFNKAIEINPHYAPAWNGKGAILYELGRPPEETLEAFNKAIEIDPKDALAHKNLAEVYFSLGAIEQAEANAKQAISLNNKLTPALLLKGKIEIEQKEYAKASQTFALAISSDLGNPLPLLWKAYAQYLQAESSHQPDSLEYREEVTSIIRQLERINKLVVKGNDKARAYTLYFLGCFYYKMKDISEAVSTHRQCVKFKSESPVKTLACELLDNIWNYAVKPPLWRWWWFSPLHCRLRRVISSIIPFFIAAPVAASPFVRIDWGVYMFITTILLIILALPNIQRIRAREIEVELRSPPSMEPVLSPSMMEMKIKELEASPER